MRLKEEGIWATPKSENKHTTSDNCSVRIDRPSWQENTAAVETQRKGSGYEAPAAKRRHSLAQRVTTCGKSHECLHYRGRAAPSGPRKPSEMIVGFSPCGRRSPTCRPARCHYQTSRTPAIGVSLPANTPGDYGLKCNP